MRLPDQALFLVASLLMTTPALAGEALWDLQRGMQGCIANTPLRSCPPLQAQVDALRRNPAYEHASHLCKEEIEELGQLITLLPERDADATDLMVGVADVQQACLPYGF